MKTFENLPGVTVGDMGEKIGLNGVDNGYFYHMVASHSGLNHLSYTYSVMMFDHFRIPREALLNRNGDVNDEGVYVSPIKNKKKRLGNSLLQPLPESSLLISFHVIHFRSISWRPFRRPSWHRFNVHHQLDQSHYDCNPLLGSASTVWSG